VLDQMGRHDEAQRYYATALRIAPAEASVLSNLGLSYALSKDLVRAESTLRRATTQAGADTRVRQNLALAVGLQGRLAEAETIAHVDLPSEEPAANVSYLRKMLAQQNGWPEQGEPDKRVRILVSGIPLAVLQPPRTLGLFYAGPRPCPLSAGKRMTPVAWPIARPTQIWRRIIASIPIGRGFLYLRCDQGLQASRAVLSWRLAPWTVVLRLGTLAHAPQPASRWRSRTASLHSRLSQSKGGVCVSTVRSIRGSDGHLSVLARLPNQVDRFVASGTGRTRRGLRLS
jgi:hypothetical protein